MRKQKEKNNTVNKIIANTIGLFFFSEFSKLCLMVEEK